MSKPFTYNTPQVMAADYVPENLKNKFSLLMKMKEVCGIDENTDVPDEWFDRVDEVMTVYELKSRGMAESLVAIEYSIATGSYLETAFEYAGDLAEGALSTEFPNIGEEEILAFKTNLKQRLANGQNFLVAFHASIDDRKRTMSEVKSFDVFVNEEGVVSPTNERREE